jgi:hypothetical protein
MLYKKLLELPASTLNTSGIISGEGLRWGNAETLLLIAQKTEIFAKNTVNHSAGPEYIRKSDAELQMRKEE